MREYLVTWEIEVEGESPRDAAEQARQIQLDQVRMAVTFTVVDVETDEMTEIDLMDRV